MILPLLSGWRASGEHLPEPLWDMRADTPFTLPGADALSAFADLIGGEDDAPSLPAPQEEALPGAPFPLPAVFPEDFSGEVTLTREVDFSALEGDRALLTFDLLMGEGSLTLQSLPPRFMHPGAPGAQAITLTKAFLSGPLTLDVSQALLASRRFTLTLRFSPQRPAGVCGPVLLRVSRDASLEDVILEPDAAREILTLRANVCARRSGNYALRAQLCPAHAPTPENAPPVREITLHAGKGESVPALMTMSADLPAFTPGQPFAAPGIKLWLFPKVSGVSPLPCDEVTLMCGFPGPAPAYTLPLEPQDVLCPPEQVTDMLRALHVPGVSLPAHTPDILLAQLTREGISAQCPATPENRARLSRFPCVRLTKPSAALPEAPSPALSAWQLCGLVTYPRPTEPGMTEADLLLGCAGRETDPAAPDTAAVLSWLRAFSLRLRAEAMRQGKCAGALCAPGEHRQADVAQAIRTALAPLHLSALPLCGAWWTHSHFSATLAAYIPKDVLAKDQALRAEAVLEDAQGEVIAKTAFPCAPWRKNTGLITATLPGTPCVLELITRIYADEQVIEESVMPVYVGERGMLEAAFNAQLI